MLIIDTGPLVALIDKQDKEMHEKCAAIVRENTGVLHTTIPCLTEAMHFLRSRRGWKGQATLWQYVTKRHLVIFPLLYPELMRVQELMQQYHDTPMSIADASLVVLAETQNIHRILTTDSDFFAYRIHGKDSFEVLKPDI